MQTHSQAAQPYSNKHVIQNFWRLPPTSKLCQHTLPNNCVTVGKELQLFCCGLGMPERGAGRRREKRNMRRLCRTYLGSSLSATPLCIWNALVLSRFFFSPKRVRFSRPGSLIFGCVLGYWHALCTGWRPDWASGCWGQGRRTVSPLSQQPCHHTSDF